MQTGLFDTALDDFARPEPIPLSALSEIAENFAQFLLLGLPLSDVVETLNFIVLAVLPALYIHFGGAVAVHRFNLAGVGRVLGLSCLPTANRVGCNTPSHQMS